MGARDSRRDIMSDIENVIRRAYPEDGKIIKTEIESLKAQVKMLREALENIEGIKEETQEDAIIMAGIARGALNHKEG